MDYLKKDLNLTTLRGNGESLLQVSLSSESPMASPINSSEFCALDGYFNHELALGALFH